MFKGKINELNWQLSIAMLNCQRVIILYIYLTGIYLYSIYIYIECPVQRRPTVKRSLKKKPKRESWDLFRESCCSRGSRCAQPKDISFYSLISQILEEKQLRITRYIFWCTIDAQFKAWPWTKRGKTVERLFQGVERPIQGVEKPI